MKKNELIEQKKGIILLRNIDPKTDFSLFKKFLQVFGKISNIFFTKINHKRKNGKGFFFAIEIVGWVEYFFKVEAKKVTLAKSRDYKYFGGQNKKIRINYLKKFKWNNLKILFKKKKK
jgi:hypothetical protein